MRTRLFHGLLNAGLAAAAALSFALLHGNALAQAPRAEQCTQWANGRVQATELSRFLLACISSTQEPAAIYEALSAPAAAPTGPMSPAAESAGAQAAQACGASNATRSMQVVLDCGCIGTAVGRRHASGDTANARFDAIDKAPCLDREASAVRAVGYCQRLERSPEPSARCECMADLLRSGQVPAKAYVAEGYRAIRNLAGKACQARG